MKIPQRKSVLLQTTDILRAAIRDGTWRAELPSERDLCKRLHVSRPTLRAALEILEREKLIQAIPGKRRQICSRPIRRNSRKAASVVLVSSTPLYAMSRNRIFLVDHLHRSLETNSIQFEVYSNPAFAGERPQFALKQMLKKTAGSSYILALAPRQAQQWFGDQGLNCMIIGSSFPDINIPSIDCDYPATGRHAAGTLLGRGHRSVLLLAPNEDLAGLIEVEEGFKHEFAISKHQGAACHAMRHSDSPQSVIDAWQRQRQSGNPATAAFLISQNATATLMTHLLNQRIHIPDEFSILCRDHAPMFDWMQPKVAHYVLPLQQFASKLSTLATQMAQNGTLPPHDTRIMPELHPASSLGHRRTRNTD